MAEYINRDDLLNVINSNVAEKHNERCSQLLEAILNAPLADVVEVVRCGQCKNWRINPNNLYGGYCKRCECASIDHYCSYGQRRENESN